jgi:hypothetical protein
MKNWKEMEDDEKLECLKGILTKVGCDKTFREECSQCDLEKVKAAVAREGNVEFDDEMTVRFIKTKEDAEKEIVLLMPEYVESCVEVDPTDGYWLCTYITYAPGRR